MSGPFIDRLSRSRRPLAALALAAGLLALPDVEIGTGTGTGGDDPATHPTRAPLAAAGTAGGTVVHPLVLLSVDDERLTFSALGRDWDVVLAPHELLSRTARAELDDPTLPRLFDGRVVGDDGSWVRLSRDAGRVSGHLFTGGQLHRIEPPGAGGDYRLVRVGAGADPGAALLRRSGSAPVVSRAMRIGIVVDSRYDAYHDGRGLAHALGVMNGVDGLYREQLGLAVVIERVRVHDDPASDPIRTRGGTIEDVLSAFRGIRLGDPGLPADLALVHLFSGHEAADDVIGLGWIDTVCRVDGFDVSVATPFAFDTLLSAHEIAHNLGALHDEDPSCDADGSGARAAGLMEERLSSDTVTEFSACSLERLQRMLGADCLVDSLDLALDVTVSTGAADDERLVAVSVANTDPFRTARAVRTRTRLPAGARTDELAAGCSVSDALLVCEHGDVAPESAAAVTALVGLPPAGIGTGTVAVIDPGAFVDSDPANDRVAFDLVADEARPADVAAGRMTDDAATETLADASPPDAATVDGTGGEIGGAAGDDGGGGGAASLALLALLALLPKGGRRRPCARPGIRSTRTRRP